MQPQLSGRSLVLALAIVLTFVVSWEFYIRHRGFTPDYDDGPELWADNRGMVYEPADRAVLFIGSSRIKYDVDIPTWQKLTGTHAIQLAMVGSSPRHFLTDLANDPKFKGRLIVDVTEGLFFSKEGNWSPDHGIEYYKKRTPAQRASFILDKPLEGMFAFLNTDGLSLNPYLSRLPIPNRKGMDPFTEFPIGFYFNTLDRQSKMTDDFVADTNQHNVVRAIWYSGIKQDTAKPISGKALDTIMRSVKVDVDKIRARGGVVIFTRTPSNGPYLAAEKKNYPRKGYWEKMLKLTGCQGVHYTDYPAMAPLVCPEWSHLRPHDAVIFTTSLVEVLEKEKGWHFNQGK